MGQFPGSRFMYRDENGVWDRIRWDGKTAAFFALGEMDEKKAREKLRSVEGF
jgi:hypothetical protein